MSLIICIVLWSRDENVNRIIRTTCVILFGLPTKNEGLQFAAISYEKNDI